MTIWKTTTTMALQKNKGFTDTKGLTFELAFICWVLFSSSSLFSFVWRCLFVWSSMAHLEGTPSSSSISQAEMGKEAFWVSREIWKKRVEMKAFSVWLPRKCRKIIWKWKFCSFLYSKTLFKLCRVKVLNSQLTKINWC